MINTNLTKEAVLILRFSQNDEKAALAIFDLYFKNLCSFVERYVQSKELAEDIVQEVFIKIWENRSNLSEVQSFKAYLFTVAKNHTLNFLKKASRSEVAMGEVVNSYCTNRNETEEAILDKEYLAFFNKVLDSLPNRSREIFKLCREEKKSYEEVAQLLGVSKNAVKNHMVYSMKSLKEATHAELGIPLTVLLAVLSQ